MNALFWFFTILVLVYLSILGTLYLVQDAMIFPRPPPSPSLYKTLDAKPLRLNQNELTLQGWEIDAAAAQSKIIILYFGGNAEDVAMRMPLLKSLSAAKVVSFNYRGYGNSEGKPSQKAIFSDASDIYALIRKGHPQKDIVIIGRSLGTAVAAHLAATEEAAKVVLVTPLHSVSKVAGELFYGLIPKVVIRHPLPVAKLAEKITAPSLVLIAEHDEVIPKQHSLLSFQALAGDKHLREVKGAQHNDILDKAYATETINAFIENRLEHN